MYLPHYFIASVKMSRRKNIWKDRKETRFLAVQLITKLLKMVSLKCEILFINQQIFHWRLPERSWLFEQYLCELLDSSLQETLQSAAQFITPNFHLNKPEISVFDFDVPQNFLLSPILFLMFIDRISEQVVGLKKKLFIQEVTNKQTERT